MRDRPVPKMPSAHGARREFMLRTGALIAAASCARSLRAQQPRINPPALLDNDVGAYKILPAGAVFCGGVLPNEGFEVVHALLRPWLPLERGYAFIESYLKSLGRPVQALCGMELRVPAQMTFEQFRTFNAPYIEQLRKWQLVFGSYSGVCRTNVAPALQPPDAASLHAFSYTGAASAKAVTFCVSGTADIDPRGKIIAEGDTGPAGMQKRAQYTIEVIGARLAELDLTWQDATQVDLHHVANIPDLWGPTMLGAVGDGGRRGVRVYHARPPIVGAEVELEARAVRQELVLSTSTTTWP